jgi:hypothetical protein
MTGFSFVFSWLCVFIVSKCVISYANLPSDQTIRLEGWGKEHESSSKNAVSQVYSSTSFLADMQSRIVNSTVKTFTYNGTDQLYTAPDTVEYLKVRMWGAGGGGGTIEVGPPYISYGGGAGGYVKNISIKLLYCKSHVLQMLIKSNQYFSLLHIYC